MKREMTDTDVVRLEQMLRHIRPASSPAPQSVHEFVATVPATTTTRRPVASRLSESRAIRRGAFAVGLAAALVVALVVSSFLVNIRQTGPAASADWTWQKADGSVMGGALRVARGYVTVCMTPGMVAATPTESLSPGKVVFHLPDSLCTSVDGATWTNPPDPRIMDIPTGSTFPLASLAQFGSISLLAKWTSDAAGNDVTDLYRSADGVSWKRVDDPQLRNLQVTSLGVVHGQFMGVATDVSTSIGWIIRSPDGQSWERASQLPDQPGSGMVQAGLIFYASVDGVWRASRDGSSWQDVHLPAGIWDFWGVVELSAGGYIASGMGEETALHILRSDDGLSWRIDDGDIPGTIIDLTLLDGGRCVASVQEGAPSPPNLGDPLAHAGGLWQSFDNGRTWSRLIGPDGRQMTGETVPVGDRLGVLVRDAQGYRHLAWVGTPGRSPAPAAP